MIKYSKNVSSYGKESLVETHSFNATITTVKDGRFLNFSTTIFEGIIPKTYPCLKLFYKGSAKRNLILKSHDLIAETINAAGEKGKKPFVEAIMLAVDRLEKMGIINYIMVSDSYNTVFKKQVSRARLNVPYNYG